MLVSEIGVVLIGFRIAFSNKSKNMSHKWFKKMREVNQNYL